MRVYAAGPVLEDGGTMFVAEGCAPGGLVTWSLTGNGSLTPTQDHADLRGVATAVYSATDGTPAAQGQTLIVSASSYA